MNKISKKKSQFILMNKVNIKIKYKTFYTPVTFI